MSAMQARPDRLLPLALCAAAMAGCGGFGQVNQGRVIAYDATAGRVTVISDSNYREPGKPRFDVLPPVTIGTPEDPREMGPAPRAGNLLHIDGANRRLIVFSPAKGGFETIPYTPVKQQDNVFPDDPRVRGASYPRIEGDTIELYSPGERRLVTISVGPEHRSLPEATWRFGDEVRYYYKRQDRALRLMNVTQTDVTKAGK